MTKHTTRMLYTSTGIPRVAKTIGSDSRGRQLFQLGILPTEFLIDGKRPAVSAETLRRVDRERLAARKGGRLLSELSVYKTLSPENER